MLICSFDKTAIMAAAQPDIRFFFLDAEANLPQRTALKQFISSLFKKEKKKLASLNYIFCSDEYLLRVNQQYLKHDYYTDIITFDLSEMAGSITGEIYISLDRVRDNAKKFQTTLKTELHRVIFHGALHLCGYNDKTKAQQQRMRQAEDVCLNTFFAAGG